MFVLVLAGVVGLVALTNINAQKQDEVICANVDIQIDHDRDIFFLDQSDIQDILVKTFGDSVKGDRIQKIDVGRIENVIEKDPYVEDTETWLSTLR